MNKPKNFQEANELITSHASIRGDIRGDISLGHAGPAINNKATLILLRTGKKQKCHNGEYQLKDVGVFNVISRRFVRVFAA